MAEHLRPPGSLTELVTHALFGNLGDIYRPKGCITGLSNMEDSLKRDGIDEWLARYRKNDPALTAQERLWLDHLAEFHKTYITLYEQALAQAFKTPEQRVTALDAGMRTMLADLRAMRNILGLQPLQNTDDGVLEHCHWLLGRTQRTITLGDQGQQPPDRSPPDAP
jgi:hypothetical protein